MNKFTAALFILFVLACGGAAQNSNPSPTPLPADETDVVKITTTLIQLDITVTDNKGTVIKDLRPEEIEVFENGEKQKITNFSFVSNLRGKEVSVPKANDKNLLVLTPVARHEAVRRSIALIVDDLTLSFQSTHSVRHALRKYVDEQMQDGDLVAIIRTGAGIGALQQFTNDKRQLYAAIERLRWNPRGFGKIGVFAPLAPRTDPNGLGEDPVGSELDLEEEFDSLRESLFATGTLGAVNYVIRGMQSLPGRKSVLLLSDGFSLFTRDASGATTSNRVLQSLRRLVDMANRASVVVYTMDARGLLYTGLTAADATGERTGEQLEEEIADRRRLVLDTQEGLRYLAKQTGGLSIINNNDLPGGIRKILDDQSYYLIGYEPDDATFDPKTRRFNKLEVKVTRPGTRVRYRSGFFGVSDENLTRPQLTSDERVLLALTSPFAVNDISLRLNAIFLNSRTSGTMVRSLVHFWPQDLRFSDEAGGGKKVVFDLVAIAFGDNGVPVEEMSNTFTIKLDKNAYEQALKRGFIYDLAFPIKKPGAYQFRVALRDHGTDRLGSANQFVEVPNLKKNRLVLSGVVLENIEFSEWQKRDAGKASAGGTAGQLTDTSLRQFKNGTVLSYGFAIYNARLAPAPNLTYQSSLFREGKLVFQGQPQTIPIVGQDLRAIDFARALLLPASMVPGDYVLQVVITDN